MPTNAELAASVFELHGRVHALNNLVTLLQGRVDY